jgi:response regulator RpfG family c-di-GMP phosphodiesterase
MESSNSKILFVDDDLNILMTIRRQLAGEYEVDTAHSGSDGLATLRQNGPYAVVVSDQRMPGMDGTQFLSEVRSLSPDTVRVMLTGYAEMQHAIDAVNKGNVFRFLLKPVRRSDLLDTLRACFDQYNLVTAERDLLRNTLRGSIQVLSEILSLTNPVSFSQTMRVRTTVRQLAEKLNLTDVWQFELAALLSQMGCITLSPEILSKVYAGESLSADESRMFASHPKVGSELLNKIPRLELIAEMIRRQHDDYAPGGNGSQPLQPNRAAVGGHLLRIALAYDRLLGRGRTPVEAVEELQSQPDQYYPAFIRPLGTIQNESAGTSDKSMSLKDLKIGMIINDHVYAETGLLVAPRGLEVSTALLAKLNAYAETVGIREPIRVMTATAA